MKTGNLAWRFIILLLVSIMAAVSCQQPELPAETATDNTSLETVYEIPEGTEPQRAETYDDIVDCQRFYTYRANCPYVGTKTGPDWVRGPDFIRHAEVTLSGCEFTPRVTYRDHIESKAGEIRYNMFSVVLKDDGSQRWDEYERMYSPTGKPAIDYGIKLLGTYPDIQVKKIGEGHPYPIFEYKKIYLMIEISSQVKPGDYTLRFTFDFNGQNCGELPCVIHVTE